MTPRRLLRSLPICFFFLAFAVPGFAQVSISQYGENSPDHSAMPKAKVEEKLLAQLDVAREVAQFDALADGSHWFVVDKFGVVQTMVVDGVRVKKEFNSIPRSTAQFSPLGDYLIWLGLDRHYTETGFDSTLVYVYKGTALAGSFLADYPVVEYSRTGKMWGVAMPYANVLQQGDRDLVMINGAIVGKNLGKPRDISFNHDESTWAYRATEKKIEYLVTASGVEPMMAHSQQADQADGDSVMFRLSPDVSFRGLLLEGRDFDLGFTNTALLRRTSNSPERQDTSHMFITFRGKQQSMYRWIQNVLIDTNGKHIVYFACDPAQEALGKSANERKAVVVYDGAVIAGPFEGAGRIFLSPSGAHFLFATGTDQGSVFLDKKAIGIGLQAQDAVWSRDEKHVGFSASGTHGKVFVVAGGKRSREYESIGRMAWSPNGKTVEYVALLNGKLIKVKQSL